MSRTVQILIAVALLAIVGAVGMRQYRAAQYEERLRLEEVTGAVAIFDDAPKAVFRLRDETQVPLDSYRGKVVFINFWATWCRPCLAEMPSLIELYDDLDHDDIVFVSIAEDDNWPPLDAYLKRKPLPFDVYRDRPPRQENLFGTKSYPDSFLIDKEGQVVYRFKGSRDWSRPEFRALFEMEGVGLDGG